MAAVDRSVRSALSVNDVPAAMTLAESAVSRGLEAPLFLNLMAHRRELDGDYPEALALLDRALRIAPNDPHIIGSIGDCLLKSGRPTDALEAFDAAIAIWPGFARGYHGRGLALAHAGDKEGAREAQQRAVALDPKYADPLGALAARATEEKNYVAARDYAGRALALDPGQPGAILSLATIDMLERNYEAAATGVGRLLAGGGLALLHEAAAQRLHADALDALDRPSDAMAAYAAANIALRRVHLPPTEAAGTELGVELCERLEKYFGEARTAPWPKPTLPSVDSGVRSHVFLVGFPRSGTTLLEQVLASHPDIVTLEEKPTLDPILPYYFHDAGALNRLIAIDGDEIAKQRENYWSRVSSFNIDYTGKVFVEKLPLNTIYLPIVAKLFPEAKIVLALRDPRDVVVSCFRRRFQPNHLVIEYTDIIRTAQFYSGVMRLAELYRGWLPLSFYPHHHENLIENFDKETRALCAFLDIPWNAAMRDFATTAEGREILTPSAPQVRRGLYKEGMGQWRRFREALTEVLPILQPWVERFGYPPA